MEGAMIRIRIPAGVWVAVGWIAGRMAAGEFLNVQPIIESLAQLGIFW